MRGCASSSLHCLNDAANRQRATEIHPKADNATGAAGLCEKHDHLHVILPWSVEDADMAQAKRSPGHTRRTPRQQRSRQAVEAIFEATARLIEDHGLEKLTTARIAELAGYGVGTLYDYFPDKNAILIAMARQELDKVVGTIQKSLVLPKGAEKNGAAIQSAMRALIRGFGGRQRLRGALLTVMIAHGHSEELSAPIEIIVNFIRQQDKETDINRINRLSSEQLYILTRAVTGIIRAWAMEGCTRINAQALEVELTGLVISYIDHSFRHA